MTSTPSLDDLFDDSDELARTSRALERVARSVVGDEHRAQDVVQSAWVEALEGPRARGRGWLRALVRSRSVDELRKRRTTPLDDPEAIPDELRSKLDVQRRVLEAVDSLDEPFRSTVYLRYFDGLPPRKIARRLGVPTKTVNSRLLRAHQRLRERLAPEFRDERGQWSAALLSFGGVGSTALGSAASVTLSALLMKKLIIAAVVLVSLTLGWAWWTNSDRSRADTTTTVAASEEGPSGVAADSLASPRQPSDVPARASFESVDDVQVAAVPPGILELEVVDVDGQPVETQVLVTLRFENGEARSRELGATDALGRVAFTELRPGRALASSHRPTETPLELEIRAGETHRRVLVVRSGARVFGRVVDADDRPVADARVWLTAENMSWASGAVVATSDARGRFEVLDAPRNQSLGALLDGHGPSHLVDLDTLTEGPEGFEVELRLTAGGASLSGRVLDVAGEPVPHALVLVGAPEERRLMRADMSIAETWSPHRTRTDAEGRFSFGGLASGAHSLEARALGTAVARLAVNLDALEETRVDLTLERGATLVGRVTNEDGEALAGALVFVHPAPIDRSHLQSGQVQFDGVLDPPKAVTDETGRYALSGVPSGRGFTGVLERPGRRMRLDEVVDYVLDERSFTNGERAIWNPTLSSGLRIHGRASYQDGTPIDAVPIVATHRDRGDVHTHFMTDGTFEFRGLESGPYSLEVRLADLPAGAGTPVLRDVWPNTGPVELVADHSPTRKVPTAKVRIRLVDDHGRTNPSVGVMLEFGSKPTWVYGSLIEEHWTFLLTEADSYRAVALSDEEIVAVGEPFEITGGEDLLLPDLETTASADVTLAFELEGDPVTAVGRGVLTSKEFQRAQGFEVSLSPRKRTVRLDNLEPGDWELRLFVDGIVRDSHQFRAEAATRQTVKVPLRTGRQFPYEIHWDERHANEAMRFTCVDVDSREEFLIGETPRLGGMMNPWSWKGTLPPGSYEYVLARNGVEITRQPFTLPESGPVPTLRYEK